MFWLTVSILTNIQNICFFKVLNTTFLHNLWLLPVKRRLRVTQIVIITIFVVHYENMPIQIY